MKVALGLSGGVDSAVSAHLLKKNVYDVSCFYLICYDADFPGCRADQDRKDALSVAMHLGLPFQVLDFQNEYQKAVIDYFKNEYVAGRTPNPDVVCNREIKFGLFYDWAMKNNFDYISTGHYARIIRDKGQRLKAKGQANSNSDSFSPHPLALSPLARPKDLHKDQTYFLWQVPREKFKHVLFPLGDLLKSKVRAIAKRIKLPIADKKDSTGICFIGEVRVEDFLKRLGVKEKMGDVVIRPEKVGPFDSKRSDLYTVVGTHRGVAFYTIGQRHGFEISGKWKDESGKIGNGKFSIVNFQLSSSSDRPPLYVIEKDVKHNRLVVGFGAECYRDRFVISDYNWLTSEKVRHFGIKRSDLHAMNCFVRIRHGGELIPCVLEKVRPSRTGRSDLKKFLIRLSSAQRGVAPGQSAVFYLPDGTVLGGGVIQ